MDEKCLRVGVGFATGRRSFQNVLRSYVYHLEESGFVAPGRVSLTLLVAFDPAYSGTARADYENMEPRVRQWFDEVAFFSPEDVENAAEALVRRGVAPAEEKRLLFGNGYAAQRNKMCIRDSLKALCSRLGIDNVSMKGGEMVLRFSIAAQLNPMKLLMAVKPHEARLRLVGTNPPALRFFDVKRKTAEELLPEAVRVMEDILARMEGKEEVQA